MIGGINYQLDRLDGRVVTTEIKLIYTKGGDYIPMQHGGSFVVPPGYPNDTFRVGLSSGERVTVTPTTNNNYNLTINSRAPTERVRDDFQMMKALAR